MVITKKIFASIRIIRPINVIITFLVVVVAVLITQEYETELSTLVLASVSAALVAASGNIINDIYDVEIDKISHPNRVLVLGLLSKQEAMIEYIFLTLVSASIAASLSGTLLIIVIITSVLLFTYALYFKKVPLTGNIIVAFITGLAFIYGGFAAGNPKAAVIPAVFAFLINLIREIVKDIQDTEGDSAQNVKTFPIKYGIDSTKKLIAFITILLITFTFYPFIMQLYKIEYFIVVMVFVNPIFVLCLKFIFEKNNLLNKVSNLLKLNMILGLISIYIGN
ncbi:MAG: geranylgeranylglycerol-phosphate geranylgeranyltransferase [Ignavibacteriaceae bacterium]